MFNPPPEETDSSGQLSPGEIAAIAVSDSGDGNRYWAMETLLSLGHST